MRHLTLLTRPGCHLCEAMEAELLAAYGDRVAVDLVHIDHHPAWLAQYSLRIPVLLDAAGQWLCEVQLDTGAIDALLATDAMKT